MNDTLKSKLEQLLREHARETGVLVQRLDISWTVNRELGGAINVVDCEMSGDVFLYNKVRA